VDNASKAAIMAGAVIIALLIISLSLFVVALYRRYADQEISKTYSNQSEAYNRFFVYTGSSGSSISGYDAYNVICKAFDINSNLDTNDRIIVSGCGVHNSTNPSDIDSVRNYFRISFDSENHMVISNTDRLERQNYGYSYGYNNAGRIDRITISG